MDLVQGLFSKRVLRGLALVIGLSLPFGATAFGQSEPNKPAATDVKPAPEASKSEVPKPAPSTPDSKAPPSSTPATPTPAPTTPGSKAAPPAATPDATPPATTPSAKPPSAVPETKAPETKPPEPGPDTKPTPEGKPEPNVKPAPGTGPHDTEIEPNGSPGIPQNAQTESVDVPARPVVMIAGRSSYDDAFKSIKASLESVRKAMDKAGLKPAGHPVTIFSEPDDKGFKYKAAIPIASKPDGKLDLGADITIGESPAGKAIKFQHRGAYEDIDSTYDVITAYLDAKGLQVDNPYIEEYLTDLTTPDDPNLQVDIYVFVKP